MKAQGIVALVGTVILATAVSRVSSAQDVLVLKNGDRLTGEVKKLSGGDLHFDTDYAESVFVIDWGQVERVETAERYVFETSVGMRLAGSFKTDPEDPDSVVIAADSGEVRVPSVELVSVEPVETDFLGRIGVGVDFGYTFTKANNNQQLTLRSNVSYTEENWIGNAGFDTLQNLLDIADDTRRTNIGGSYRRFLTDRWFALGAARLLMNDEQQLDLRSTLYGGLGAYLKRTQELSLSSSFGAAWTNENYQDPDIPTSDSAEAFGGLDLDVFDVGALDLRSTFIVFPSVSQWGRVRFDFDIDTSWEIIDDFFFRVGYFHNFDSDPLNQGEKNDFGLTTSVGWSL